MSYNVCAKPVVRSYFIVIILWFSVTDYIDQVFGGGSSLWPTDPYLKAKARLILTDFGNNVCCTYFCCCIASALSSHLSSLAPGMACTEVVPIRKHWTTSRDS